MTRIRVGTHLLELARGDILQQDTDAIVTAANSGLRGGGGVDGAIHRAAGPSLLEACRELGGCPTGDAVATHSGRLPHKTVVHAVGPIYGNHGGAEHLLLACAHRRSLEVAGDEGCASIAFPAISCGVYGFPVHQAAFTALGAVIDHLARDARVTLVRYVLFLADDHLAFSRALREIADRDHRVTPLFDDDPPPGDAPSQFELF